MSIRWLAVAALCAWALGRFAEPAHAQPAEVSGPSVRLSTTLPSWVEAVEAPPPREDASGSRESLLDDRQLYAGDGYVERFVRTRYRVLNGGGVANGSEIALSVAADEQLTWHHVRRIRDGQSVEMLRSVDELRVLRPEASVHRDALIDDRHTAVLVLDDIRPGDVIEVATTRRRSLALFGGRFVTREVLAGSARSRLSVRWPAGREPHARLANLSPEWSVERSETSLVVEARDVPPVERPLDAPEWWEPWPSVYLSEFEDWNDVARWAASMYAEVSERSLPESAPLAELAGIEDPVERVAAALRYVQEDVRYLGLELGENRMRPHAPAEVAATRRGDCKDKALLLLSVLAQPAFEGIDVSARAALVHSRARTTLDDALASPLAFDHVVVRLQLGDEVFWVDPTRRAEPVSLAERPPLVYERALLVDPAAEGLVEIPSPAPAEPSYELLEHFDATVHPPTYVVQTTYRGESAAAVRQHLESTSVEELGEEDRAQLESLGREVTPTAPAEVEHLPGNAVRVIERYTLPRLYTRGRCDVDAWALWPSVGLPDSARPSGPFGVRHPLFVRHRVIVETRRAWEPSEPDAALRAGPLELTRQTEVEGRRIEMTATLRSSSDHVPEAEVEAFTEQLEALRLEVGQEIRQGSFEPVRTDPAPAGWVCLPMVLLGLLGLVVVGGHRYWVGRRRRAFEAKQRGAPGETPELAHEVADRAAAVAMLGEPKCCGASMGLEWSGGRLGGRRLLIAACRCASCAGTRRVFFHLADRQ